MQYFKILLKIRFRHTPVLSLVFAFSFAPTRTIPKPLKQHPIYKKIIHSAIFKDLGEKFSEGSFISLWTHIPQQFLLAFFISKTTLIFLGDGY
jgi:hypothetical protein